MEKLNVATRGTPEAERKRIPMSVPVRNLEVPDIPGYHLHWFVNTPARIDRALAGGYEFVDSKEMRLTQAGLGTNTTHSGNTDMGSHVSVVSGTNEEGQTERLILMKIKQEWYEEDQKELEKRNDSVAEALAGGLMGADKDAAGDTNHRYVDKARTRLPAMFTKKVIKK